VFRASYIGNHSSAWSRSTSSTCYARYIGISRRDGAAHRSTGRGGKPMPITGPPTAPWSTGRTRAGEHSNGLTPKYSAGSTRARLSVLLRDGQQPRGPAVRGTAARPVIPSLNIYPPGTCPPTRQAGQVAELPAGHGIRKTGSGGTGSRTCRSAGESPFSVIFFCRRRAGQAGWRLAMAALVP